MSISNKISNIVGIYKNLSIPILGESVIKRGINFLINDKFYELFLKGNLEENHLEIIKNHISKIKLNQKIHHEGNIYQVDETSITNGDIYYFYNLSSESVQHSFLWLKHDLLNILNPIMGFADVLEESDEIAKDDKILIQKIRSNSHKLYQQIQKLSLLQNLNHEKENKRGSYEIADFITEITNQLLANNTIDQIQKIEISHNGKVSDRIIQSDFRNSLEEHLSYLIGFQKKRELKILALFYNNYFRIKFQLPICNLPKQYLSEIHEIENFINKSEAITKLQIPSLNYLILSELCHSIGASISLKNDEEMTIFEMLLPSLSAQKDIKHSENKLPTLFHTKKEEFHFQSISPELLVKMKGIFEKFDGLLILDEWQKLSVKLKHLNNTYQNSELESIINDIEDGIESFDVEKLRSIYHLCHNMVSKTDLET